MKNQTTNERKQWLVRHEAAWSSVLPGHKGERVVLKLRDALVALSNECKQYEYTVGEDAHAHDIGRAICNALLDFLNRDCGRLNCGTVDAWVRNYAESESISLDD